MRFRVMPAGDARDVLMRFMDVRAANKISMRTRVVALGTVPAAMEI